MIKTVVQCSSTVEQLLKGGDTVSTSQAMCEDSSENTHIFPNICDGCKGSNNYVIADYLTKVPGARFDLIRAWKEESRQPKSESSGGATNANVTANSSTASVQSNNLSAPAGKNESTDPSQSTSPSSASSKTSSNGARDLTEIKTRLDRLKGRVEHLLTKLDAQKVPIENDAADSRKNKD